MSTRSRIGYINPKTGEVKSVYCHFDGYPSNNGKILFKHYTKREDVEELVELGDMSCLGESIDSCEFYGRDRGESDTGPRTDVSFQGFKNRAGKSCEEYMYFMDENDQWQCISVGALNHEPFSLEEHFKEC